MGLSHFVAYLLCLPFLLICCDDAKQSLSPPTMWGNLEPGPHSIGFTTQFLYDLSRPAIPYSDWNGKIFPTTETKGRQMQLNIWYPAKAVSESQRLRYEHYVHLMGQQAEFGTLNEQLMAFADQQFIEKTNLLGGNGAFTQASLDSLKGLQTHAFLDAEANEGKFPLLVFPGGGSPAFQSIQCEYLASHGYVVASVALKGQHAFTDEASPRGVETAVMDLQFAIQHLVRLPQVDKEKIGLMGNAITSSQIVAYQSRNPNVDCIISLEGGLLSSFEQRILDKTPFYDAHAVDVPILAIYAPHPSIDPSYIFKLKHADRYFFHFPQMTEFHFLNYGPFERFVPGILGEHEGDVQAGYEWASQYVLNFLEAFLKDKSASREYLTQDISPDILPHIDTSFVKQAMPRVPNITHIKNNYTASGFAYIDSVYQKHKEVNPAPFSLSFYTDMKNWLAWQKDPDFTNRYQLYKLAYDSYPQSAEVNYYLSYFALETERNEESRFHIQKALDLLDTSENPEMTLGRKQVLQQSLQEFRTMLNN